MTITEGEIKPPIDIPPGDIAGGIAGALPGAVSGAVGDAAKIVTSPLGALGDLVLGPVAEIAVTLVLAAAGMALVVLALVKAAGKSETVRTVADVAPKAAVAAAAL